MKNKITAISTIFASLLISSSVFAAPEKNATEDDTVWLSVSNSWTSRVHLKEGKFGWNNADIHPNNSVELKMYSGQIYNLHLTYFHNGLWEDIPGCPTGSFHSTLRISIHRSIWDPNTPTCNMF